ncbi:MAG: helix-turn-helix domain-containing protein [Solirubrobacterales bacterium]
MSSELAADSFYIEYLKARPVVTVAEASELTTLSQSGIRRAIRNGGVPARKIGRRVLIDTCGLLAWVGVEAEAPRS